MTTLEMPAAPTTHNLDDTAEQLYRVQVWFGRHAVADHTGHRQIAHRYAEAMEQRFLGLNVTIEPVTADHASTPIRGDRLWNLTP